MCLCVVYTLVRHEKTHQENVWTIIPQLKYFGRNRCTSNVNPSGRFRKYEIVQALCTEESKAGWEMVEKFDNNRIRFKRRTENRTKDQYLDFDPYRTSMSTMSGQKVMLIIGLIVMLLGVGLFLAISNN